jgi:glycosyltransferase involved in cell wall biosynthesis
MASEPAIPLSLEDGSGLMIASEQLSEVGGAGRILAELRRRFPAAHVVAPLFAAEASTPRDGSAGVARWAGRKRHFLSIRYSRRLAREPRRAALVLSVGSNSWAHAVRPAPGGRHVAFVHGPPRPLYGDCDRYLCTEPAVLRPLIRARLPALRREYLRRLSVVDRCLTASRWSARHLERIHGAAWEVLNPPVRTVYFTPAAERLSGGPVLVAGRVVPHKAVDRAIEAVRGLDVELAVVGTGSAVESLRASAPRHTRFTGWVEDAELRELYRSAAVLVSPAPEEFGIVIAEAQACGVPVVAPAEGAASEIVQHGVTGLLVDELSATSLRDAIVTAIGTKWDSAACRARALRFSSDRFVQNLERVLAEEEALIAPGMREPQQPVYV